MKNWRKKVLRKRNELNSKYSCSTIKMKCDLKWAENTNWIAHRKNFESDYLTNTKNEQIVEIFLLFHKQAEKFSSK